MLSNSWWCSCIYAMHDAMHLFNNVCSSNCTLIHDVHNQYTIHNTSNDPIIMLPDAKMCMPMQNIGVGNGQPMHKMQNSFYHRLCMICNWRWLIADILHTIISIYLHLLVCNIPGADSGSIYYPQRNGADSPAVLSPETTPNIIIFCICIPCVVPLVCKIRQISISPLL